MKTKNIPAVFIDTVHGTMRFVHDNKNYKESGKIKIILPNGDIEYTGELSYIKGRGNSTWGYAKKPYNIELTIPGNIFNMGNAGRWVLLTNYNDGSYIRNKMIYETSRKVGLPYSPKSEFVDLYLNGEYSGLYQLTEKNEIGENRVNLNESLNDITGGYLLEMIIQSRQQWSSKPGFKTDNDIAIDINYPQNPTRQHIQYISSLIQEFENALYSDNGYNLITDKHYTEYIDMESWAKLYLVDEIFGNQDGGRLSFFFHKDSDSINNLFVAGPVWDYDLSIGNGFLFVRKPNVLFVYKNNWYYQLYKKNDFYQTITSLYTKVFLPLMNDWFFHEIDTVTEGIKPSVVVDKLRWSNEEHSTWMYSTETNSIDEQVSYLKEFLSQRIEFLSSVWVDNIRYCYVEIDFGDSFEQYLRWESFSVKYGDTFTGLPEPSLENYIFEGWYSLDTGEKFNPSTPITKDTYLYAKWTSLVQENLYTKIKNTVKRFLPVIFLGILTVLLIIMFAIEINRHYPYKLRSKEK